MDNPASLLTQLGIMNKISTGNTVLDLLLCMLLPVVISHAMPHMEHLRNWFQVRASGALLMITMPRSRGEHALSGLKLRNGLLDSTDAPLGSPC